MPTDNLDPASRATVKPKPHIAIGGAAGKSATVPVKAAPSPVGSPPWLWIGLFGAVMVVIVVGFWAYTLWRRKSSARKRKEQMNREEPRNLLAHLEAVKAEFSNPAQANALKYSNQLTKLSRLRDQALNNLSGVEQDAFENCIANCQSNNSDAKKIRGEGKQHKDMLWSYGKASAGSINTLINLLSGLSSPSERSHSESPQAARQMEALPSNLNKSTRSGGQNEELSALEKLGTLQAKLDDAKRTIQENKKFTESLKAEVDRNSAQASQKYRQTQAELDTARREKDNLRKDLANSQNEAASRLAESNKKIAEITFLQQQLAKQEAAWQKMQALTNPGLARQKLPEDALAWAELAKYVHDLLNLAESLDRPQWTTAATKVNEIQKVLFGPPPMNSLFDPKNPADVDVFARILYLQSDLRAKLRNQGIQVIMPAPGESFDVQRHECAEADLIWDHKDPDKHNTIYTVRTIGFEDNSTGKVLKKASVKKWMYDGMLPQEEPLETPIAEVPVSVAPPEYEQVTPEMASPANGSEELPEAAPVAEEEQLLEEVLPMQTHEITLIDHQPMEKTPIEVMPEESVSAEAVMPDEQQAAPRDTVTPTEGLLNDTVEERRKRANDTAGE